MARELLLTGDRLTIEVLAEIRALTARDEGGPAVSMAIESFRLALAQNADSPRLERALIGLAAAAIATVTRIRANR